MQGPFKLEVVSVRLVRDAPLFSDHRIISPADAVKVVGDFLCEMDREVLCVINLKSDGTPINCNIVSMGALNQTIAEPRELFKTSILSNAAQMIIVHNHLNSTLEPSKQDTMITDRMLKLTDLMGIMLIDHVIVGGDNSKYFSFHQKGMMEHPKIDFYTDYESLDFGNAPTVAEKRKAR
jgi:DNA repair protein RadC